MSELPKQILWLNDAPLFIDEKQVEAFYDAILQPDFEEVSRTFGDSISKETKIEGGINLGAALPWFVKSEAQLGASESKGKVQEQGSTLNRVINPYRHLLALTLHYATQEDLRKRLVLAGEDYCTDATKLPVDLEAEDFVLSSPRALAMLDLPPKTPFIPAALELTNGKVVRLFEDVARRFQEPGEKSLARYEHGPGPEAEKARAEYWDWFKKAFDKQQALEVVEDAVEDASIAWIDFRFPLQGKFPHLHIAGRGQYETGVFAYQFISRGYEHGLRIVGTLKSEPDINVLAIFER